MADDLLDILSNSNKDIDNQKLLQYLSGKMSAPEVHDFEKEMLDSDLMSDAVEGLKEIRKDKDMEDYARQINTKLQKQLQKNKSRRSKNKIQELPWIYITIIIILLLIVLAFVVVYRHDL